MHAGSDLVSVATALQSADLAREALVATSRAAHSTLSHGIPAAKLRPLLVGMQSDLQERVLRWAASVEEVCSSVSSIMCSLLTLLCFRDGAVVSLGWLCFPVTNTRNTRMRSK